MEDFSRRAVNASPTQQSLPAVPLATDTFIIRDNKIVQQTYAAYSPGAA